jgi:hypothetical protein
MFQTTNQLESDLQAATVLADKALRLSVGKNANSNVWPMGLAQCGMNVKNVEQTAWYKYRKLR